LSRIEEDGRNWLRRPKLYTKSCRAVIIIITTTNKILLIHQEEYDGKLFITGGTTAYWGTSGSVLLFESWHADQIKMDGIIGEYGTYGPQRELLTRFWTDI
jgi:hypothetical protein